MFRGLGGTRRGFGDGEEDGEGQRGKWTEGEGLLKGYKISCSISGRQISSENWWAHEKFRGKRCQNRGVGQGNSIEITGSLSLF